MGPRTTASRLGIQKMTILAAVISRDDKLCEAPCFNTNKFALGAYQVRCDQYQGRRGHFRIRGERLGEELVECSKCRERAALLALDAWASENAF
jgi:hypothetical protein